MSDTTPLALPAIELAEKSDPGRDPSKQVNEDACGHRETRFGHLVVLCDGMGGHAGGREASNCAIAAIFEVFDTAPPERATPDVLRDAVEEANRRVNALVVPDEVGAKPGSTVVAIVHHAHGTDVAHVGDSRAYLVHESQIFQVTRDHSMVQMLVDANMITPAQAAVHPDANKILRALGIGPEVQVEVRAQPIAHVAGDVFVLCSDGLSDLVQDSEIQQIAGSMPVAQAAGQLIALANARGGHDNITVQIVRVCETALTPPQRVASTMPQSPTDTRPTDVDQTPKFSATAVAEPSAPVTPVVAPPPKVVARPSRRRTPPIVIVALLLGLLGLAIAVAMLVTHARGRGGNVYHEGRVLDFVVDNEGGPDVEPTPAASSAPAPPFDSAELPPLPSLDPPKRPLRLTPKVSP